MPAFNLTVNLTDEQVVVAQRWLNREGLTQAQLLQQIIDAELEVELRRQTNEDWEGSAQVASAREKWKVATVAQRQAAIAALEA